MCKQRVVMNKKEKYGGYSFADSNSRLVLLHTSFFTQQTCTLQNYQVVLLFAISNLAADNYSCET